MNVKLGKLKIGQWRDLTPQELKEINNLIKSSKKEAE